jgi:transglutaminase-like putative cysteine protease
MKMAAVTGDSGDGLMDGPQPANMLIRVGYDIVYATSNATPMIIMLSIHASRTADVVGTERITTEPDVPIRYYRDSFGNICGRLTAPAGSIRLRSDTLVRDSGTADAAAPDARQLAVEDLPDDCMLYLMPSRYCETEKLTDIAWSLFKDTQPGWTRVQAICDFVHGHVAFGYEHASVTKTAFDVYKDKRGVCRDFAHLAVAFCRCMNIPARYVTGYLGDIGVPADPAPMDFSGWFEAYLSGRWYTFDARHNHPRIGRILMGIGRDAADVALTTSFGPVTLKQFTVWTDEVRTPVALKDS